jgi:protein required for attachment to host cells
LALQPAKVPEFMSGPDLVELGVLYNPEERADDRAVFSAHRGGRNHGVSGSGHAFDDHRERHRAEFERRFLQAVASRCERLSWRHGADRVILVAASRIMVRLRQALGSHMDGRVPMDELTENLTWLAPAQMHHRLASQHYLPARKPPQDRVH